MDRFQLAVEAAPNAMIVVGADGFITLVNTETEKLFGYDRLELLGRPIEMLVPERFRSNHGGHRISFFTSPATRAMGRGRDLFGVRKDGGEVPIEIGLNPISTADGQFVLASIIDITERRKTEERFQLFWALVEGVQDYGIFMLDPQGYVLSWNVGAARMMKYSANEIVGQHFSRFYTPDAISEGLPEYELQKARDDGRFEDEGWRLRRDGSRFWATVLVTAVLDHGGNLRGFSKLTRDITERKQSEERLRENDQEIRRLLVEAGDRKFRGVLEAAPDAILVINREGKIALVNKQAETLFGYDRHDLIGQDIEILMPPQFRKLHPGHRHGFFARPQVRPMGQSLELRALCKNGTEFSAEIHLSPVETEEGIVVAAAVRDITERKRAETALQLKTAEMERFTYTVSHDLKSPLITIKSFVAMIELDLASGNIDRVRSDLGRIAKAADKMNHLLEELLSLARVGRMVNTLEMVPFGSLVEEALETVAGRIQERRIVVEVARDLPTVTVDRGRIVEVLQNLIDNAAKFMGNQTEPRILIGASGDGQNTCFFVKDNGAGIEARYHERIFGLFDKLNAKSEGSGAGLALVKRIVEAHGGKIWVESLGGGAGSTFRFTLNAAPTP